MTTQSHTYKQDDALKVPAQEGCNTCADYDDECVDVRDKIKCWLYDPARGMCPYLRPAAIRSRTP